MMQREITLRISPPSPVFEQRLIEFLEDHYTIPQKIQKDLGTESYFYALLESKNAKPK